MLGLFCDLPITSQWEKIDRRLLGRQSFETLKHRVTGRLYNLNRKIATVPEARGHFRS